MLAATGFYDTNGSRCLNFHLAGAFNRSTELFGLKFEAVIDTGFAGFISMPMHSAFPLALPLNGTTPSKLADGSVHEKLSAWGRATIAGRSKWGDVILEPDADEMLIGLEFLQGFGLALVLTKGEILLFEENEEWLEKLRDTQQMPGVKEAPPPPYGPTSRSQVRHAADALQPGGI